MERAAGFGAAARRTRRHDFRGALGNTRAGAGQEGGTETETTGAGATGAGEGGRATEEAGTTGADGLAVAAGRGEGLPATLGLGGSKAGRLNRMGRGRGAEGTPGEARRAREAAVGAVALDLPFRSARGSARDREEEGRGEGEAATEVENDIVTIFDVNIESAVRRCHFEMKK